MAFGPESWKEITPSRFPWEREALAFLREHLPSHEPYRAFTNFEFLARDGSINEVDALIVTPRGCFLVEIKSWHGEIRGDFAEWIRIHDGQRRTEENPLRLANKKAKRLKELFEHNWPRGDKSTSRIPFIAPLVFLSAEGINNRLEMASAGDVVTRKDVIEHLVHIPEAQANDPRFHRIDKPLARHITQALEKIGVRTRKQRIGDYELGALLHDGDVWQEWEAKPASIDGVRKRLRIYKVADVASPEMRATIRRGAEREYVALQTANHPGLLRAEHFTQSEIGPAVVFEHDPSDERLDRYVCSRGEKITFSQRLDFLRQIAEAVAYAHGQKLVHRALAPSSVLIRKPDSPKRHAIVFNWQTSARAADSGTHSTTRGRLTATSHVSALLEDGAAAYLAPEILTTPDTDDPRLDVFSLGAIGFFLFTGTPPASSLLELTEKVKEGEGLRLESVLDGAPKPIAELLREATHPEVGRRIESAKEFLAFLEDAEEKLTRPDEPGDGGPSALDPPNAKVGERLGDEYTVKSRLGSGSSAVAYLVTRGDDASGGSEVVLKVALDPSYNERLRGEGEILAKLRHPGVVRYHETIEIAGHAALVLDRAGKETLGDRLRRDGSLQTDLLERFGRDLLEVLEYLEGEGILHRDIKPENLGITERGKNDELHLVLLDFSLSRAPADAIFAGTRYYLDPFLQTRKAKRFDAHAERFAAAMTLHEMATGVLPKWGDGVSNPSALDCEATIEGDRFPAGPRKRLAEFFVRALARRTEDRFGNTEEMLTAWRKAFAVKAKNDVETKLDEAEQRQALATATLTTTIGELLLSTRAENALDRAGVTNVRGFVDLPEGELWRMRGVGTKTRDELTALKRELGKRFGPTGTAPVANAKKSSKASGDHNESISDSSASDADLTIDALVRLLVPKRGNAKATLSWLLGLEPLPAPIVPKAPLWPSLVEVARVADLTPAGVGATLNKQRLAWEKMPAMKALQDDVVMLLDQLGEVALIDELIDKLVPLRGFYERDPSVRRRYGAAVLRGAIETERKSETPRLTIERHAERVFVAREGEGRDGSRTISAVRQLGLVADEIAADAKDGLVLAPEAALEKLRLSYPARNLTGLSLPRLARLAVSVSSNAALSSRLEIYPRGLAVDRALRLAHGAFAGVKELEVAEIHSRLHARYPECAPLPPRPELDALLDRVGFRFEFDLKAANGKGAYRSKDIAHGTISSDTTRSSRHATVHGEAGRAPRPSQSVEESESIAEARAFEERLVRADRDGAFLVLAASPSDALDAERELRHRFKRLVTYSFESLLIDALDAKARALGADWSVVLAADAAPADSDDGRRLRQLVTSVLPEIEARLSTCETTILLTNLGLLARYDRIHLIDRLRDRVTVRPSASDPGLFGLWLLVPCDGLAEAPRIDARAVPVLTPAQWARVPRAWIKNVHRGSTNVVAVPSP